MYRGMGDLVDGWWFLTKLLGVLAIFGIWKVIEIIVWLFSYVSISIN